MLTLLVGGARSGKSRLALALATRYSGPVTFIVTGEPLDEDMAARIDQHRAERPPHWSSVEEPLEVPAALAGVAEGFIVIDCLTLWVSNLLGAGRDDVHILADAARVAELAHVRSEEVVVVTNEVGSGIIPGDALSRRYRDLLGKVNAIFSSHARNVRLVVAGRSLLLGPTIDSEFETEGSQ